MNRFFKPLWIFIQAFLFLLTLSAPVPAGAEEGKLVITADDITRMKARSMEDLLNQVPGLKAGESSVAIHGNYKVKVVLDGRPINDPTSAHGGVRWDMISLENVDKIEILKGKGSLEYGDDAGGGVIVITTRKINEFSGNIKAYGGNLETFSTSANGRFRQGNTGISASGAVFSTGGYKLNNDKDQKRGGVKFEYSPDKTSGITFAADHLDEEKGLSGTTDYPTPFSRQETYMDSVSLSGRSGTLKANTFFNEGEKHNTDKSKNLDNTLLVRQAGADIGKTMKFENAGNLSAGLSASWGQASGTTLTEREETGASVFGVYSFDPLPIPVTFSTGLRANVYSAYDNSLQPDIKISFRKEDFQATAGYNRSSNAPTFYQRYNRTSSTIINPDLGMETSDNYSFSLSKNLLPDLSFGTTLFYNRITDRITYVRNSGIGQYRNIGEASYKGYDLSLNWKAHRTVACSLSYTYLEAIDETTGLWLTSKPRHKAGAEIILTPVDNLSVIAGLEAVSKVFTLTDNSKSNPGYVLYNIRAEYGLNRFTLFSEIKNLADTDYCYVDGTLAPPLTWTAGINWKF